MIYLLSSVCVSTDLCVQFNSIQIEKFEGFTILVAKNSSMECNYWIPKLNVPLGNYQMIDSFYVVNVADTNVVLGIQWVYSIGKYTIDYREMEMEY